MKALILAGGLGTRLRPLTYTRPKHLLPIANRPHIRHVFDLLQRYDLREIVLLTSYLAETFDGEITSARDRGISVEVRHETAPLGTAGALKNADDAIGDGTFVALNGDVLTNVDLRHVVDFHRDRAADATIVLTPVDDPSAYGVVPTGRDGRVERFIEKPRPSEAPTNLINAGLYVLEPSVLTRVPRAQVWSAERSLFPELVAEGARVFAIPSHAYWKDIGTPDSYLEANLDALYGRYVTDAVQKPRDGAVVVAPEATIAKGSRIFSACVGPGAVVEEGAVVERSVLLPGATVERGAVVKGSILGEAVRVAGGARVLNQTVGDRELVQT